MNNEIKIELPSKGKVYPKDHVLASGELTVRYMTGNDEMIITNPSWIQEGTNMDKLLNSVVTTKGFDALDLVNDDRMYLIIAVRAMNVGVEYPLEFIKCPKCGKKHNKPSLSIENIKEEPFIFPKTDHTNVYETTLPQTKQKVMLKKIDGHDRKEINRELSKVEKEEEYFKTLVLLTRSKALIDSDVVGHNMGSKFEFILNLPFKDAKHLQSEILKIFGVVDPLIEFKCERERCNQIIEVPVEVNENFFFPEN